MAGTSKSVIDRVAAYSFGAIYDNYVAKVERKGKSVEELNYLIEWLTGYDAAAIKSAIASGYTMAEFFEKAPKLNQNAELITGVICGVRVENIEDPFMKKVRWLDKIVDELTKGKKARLNNPGVVWVVTIKKLASPEDIAIWWVKKRQYESDDIFADLDDEDIAWFQSEEYYNIIMALHFNAPAGGSPLEFIFFYSAENKYLGFANYKIYNEEDGKAIILDFCIDQKMRNQGNGAAAYTELERYLTSEGATYVTLNASNEANLRFWKRQGFEDWQADEYGNMTYRKTF